MKINTDPMNMDALDFDGNTLYVGSGILWFGNQSSTRSRW